MFIKLNKFTDFTGQLIYIDLDIHKKIVDGKSCG